MKQVPNPALQFQVAPDGKDIRRDALNYRTNGADEFALEEAVRLKEKYGGKVTVITAGPKRTEQMLREAVAKGADTAFRVSYEDPAEFDVIKIARILAAAIRTIPHDLVLSGVQSDDNANSVTPGLIAGILGHPYASVVTKVRLEERLLLVNRELEGGILAVVQMKLPAVLSVQFGINTPRYAPLPAIMKASRQAIQELGPNALGVLSWNEIEGTRGFHVEGLSVPPAKGHGEMITGSVAEQARKVAQLLREKGFYRG